MQTGSILQKKQALGKFVKSIRLSPGSNEAELDLYQWPKVNGSPVPTQSLKLALDNAQR